MVRVQQWPRLWASGSKQSDSLDLSEQEKGEIRVDLVPLFQMLAGFGCIFWVHLGEFMTTVERFWCDFRKVYIGALYVVESRDRDMW